jgi:CRISPR-associated endonuclease/helicase Cas3
VFYARKDDKENYQTLAEHLRNVGELACGYAEEKGFSHITALAGLLHDLGKATAEFQKYLKDGGEKGSVVHAPQGAMFVSETDCKNSPAAVLLKEILEMTIFSHHNKLCDGASPDGEEIFYERLERKAEDKFHYKEVKQNNPYRGNESEINELFCLAATELEKLLNQLGQTYKNNKQSAQFALGLFVKYIYSCLIDADRLDAYLFDLKEDFNEILPDWDMLIKTFEEGLKKTVEKNLLDFKQTDEISKIRSAISEKCKAAANKDTGIYQLSVPTGGGKTLSSLRFALYHCGKRDESGKYNKKRIIYVIPYLSIIEQTAKSIRDILNLGKENDILLEHHSNIVAPEDDEDRTLRKLATSRWDQPIVVTTMVQFLETVMSASGGKLRKFHNMQDSVIIFDEIQSLPIKSIHLFNEVVSFLSKILGATVLLCTATQPSLEKTTRKNLLLADSPNLIEDVSEYFDKLKRTKVKVEEEKDTEAFSNFVFEKGREDGNTLVIVNTKKVAREVFERVKRNDVQKQFDIYHLSTSMCSAHRFDVIKKILADLEAIRKGTKTDKKIICISTQLIEAGVDVSFACVIRALAGLDSIAQAAGRCNRNGESVGTKTVFVVPLKDENLDKLKDVKLGKEIAARVIRENQNADYLDTKILKRFYDYYFVRREGEMDCPTDTGESVYEMLSANDLGKNNYKNRKKRAFNGYIAQAFLSADENFSVIDKKTKSVVVSYGKADALKERYKTAVNIKEKLAIIRELGKYSASLYDYEIDIMESRGALSVLDEEFGIWYLNLNYSAEVGVLTEMKTENYMV